MPFPLPLKLNFTIPVNKRSTCISGHLTIPCGWPLNTGLACSRRSDSRSREKNFTYRCALPERLEQAIQVWLYVQVILTKAQIWGLSPGVEKPSLLFVSQGKKLMEKRTWQNTRARVAFVIARWDFQSFQDCSLLFPNNFQMHGKLTLNNNCAFKGFFRRRNCGNRYSFSRVLFHWHISVNPPFSLNRERSLDPYL